MGKCQFSEHSIKNLMNTRKVKKKTIITFTHYGHLKTHESSIKFYFFET